MTGFLSRLLAERAFWLLLIGAGLCALVALYALGLFGLPGDRPVSQIAGCAWQTACWHDDYYAAFVNDGLIADRPSEGNFLGWIAYRVDAISTQDLFTFFSILFSVMVFLAGLQFGRFQQRREHTLDVMMGVFTSDSLAEANVRMAEMNLQVASGALALDGSASGDTDKTLIVVLDYYEFVCQGIFEGSLSGGAVAKVRGGAMKTTYETCKRYIDDRRESLNRPQLYGAFEKFVTRRLRDRSL